MSPISQPAALDAISVFDEYETHVVVLTRRGKDVPDLFRLHLTEDLAGRFRSMAHNVGKAMKQLTIVDYSIGRLLESYEMVALDAKSAPLLTDIRGYLAQPMELPLLDPASQVAKRIRMYFVCIGRPERDVYFYSSLTPRARIAQSGRLAAVFSKGTYDLLKREVLVFDPRFDGVIVDDFIFTTKPKRTEGLLDILSDIQRVATETFDHVTENLAIKNLDELKAVAVSDINMMRKMTSIADKIDKDPSYLEAMAMDKILAFLKERPQIEIDIEGTGKDAKFVFHNDPQRRWRILHLLDDDYLHSQLTELDYEANSKNLLT